MQLQRTLSEEFTIKSTRHSPAAISASLTSASIPHNRTRAQDAEEEVGRGDVEYAGVDHHRQIDDDASVGHEGDDRVVCWLR